MQEIKWGGTLARDEAGWCVRSRDSVFRSEFERVPISDSDSN